MKKNVNRDMNSAQIRTLTGGAMLTAIVIVLQLLGSFIRFGTFSISLVLAPIVIGAALYGTGMAIWLGLVFGATVLLSGDAGAFLAINVIGTIITVLVKGIAAGAGAGMAYKLLTKYNRYIATVVAAIICPVCNTGVFLIGCRVFFWETITQWGTAVGYESAGAYAILALVGVNFLVELGVNAVLSPVIVRLIDVVERFVKEK